MRALHAAGTMQLHCVAASRVHCHALWEDAWCILPQDALVSMPNAEHTLRHLATVAQRRSAVANFARISSAREDCAVQGGQLGDAEHC